MLVCGKAWGTDWINEASCVNAYLMDESSGSVIDSCGSNDLGAVGNPTYSQTGKFGTSIDFNGNDYFQADQADITSLPMTMVAWGNADSISQSNALIWIGDKDTEANYHAMYMAGQNTGDPVRAFTNGSAGFDFSAKIGFTAGTFFHVMGVWASSSSRIVYLNCVAGVAETTTNNVTGEDRTAIGMLRSSSPSAPMDGDIDEVGIFNLAFDGTDCSDIMTGGLSQADAPSTPTTVIRNAVIRNAIIR